LMVAGGVTALDDAAFERVVDVLEAKFAGVDLFQRYVEKLGEAQSIVNGWNTDEESGFRTFQRGQGLPLNSYLILPFQRITRYPLILDNMLKAFFRLYSDSIKALLKLC
jgi:hypothetical protein